MPVMSISSALSTNFMTRTFFSFVFIRSLVFIVLRNKNHKHLHSVRSRMEANNQRAAFQKAKSHYSLQLQDNKGQLNVSTQRSFLKAMEKNGGFFSFPKIFYKASNDKGNKGQGGKKIFIEYSLTGAQVYTWLLTTLVYDLRTCSTDLSLTQQQIPN